MVTESDDDRRFIYLLIVAQRRMQGAIRADAASAARAGLLMAIDDQGTPMTAIGRALDLGPSALSGLIERSLRAALIGRHPDPADRRAWIITLTEAGRAARSVAVDRARLLNARLTDGFSDDELATVSRWLRCVRDRFPRRETA